ncbi:MAG: hypothetical protein ACTTJO_00025 [Metamycoplasmataceae bacterium]
MNELIEKSNLNVVPLSKQQKDIMKEFYNISQTKVIFNKKERNILWNLVKTNSKRINFNDLKNKCPSLEHQIKKSYLNKHNIQPAIFSECVYAQTLANMMNLNKFVIFDDNPNFLPKNVFLLLNSYHLIPRYIYSSHNKTRMLIQAGSPYGVDSALISIIDLNIYTIEFKEPSSKTSELDLPKYNEDGNLVISEKWNNNYPHFKEMLYEQKNLNFFKSMGSNINEFSPTAVNIAVSNNYINTKKYADVICTEDINGVLVMFPINQIDKWAKIIGEIRPAGRNSYKVWTPIALKNFLINKKAIIKDGSIIIEKKYLEERKQRGGNNKISGYKINSLFFIKISDCKEIEENKINFNFNKIRQLNPTISAKMFFINLEYKKIKKYYGLN